MSIVAVAKRAGVSVATVSRVLNDLHNVRAETAQQVRAAMEEIGYKPPRVKRGPKTGSRRTIPSCMRTGQIAVLTLGGLQDWLGLPVMSSVVAGVMRAAKELDIRPILDEMPDARELSPILRRREVDGAVVFFMSGLPLGPLVQLRQHLPVVWAMGGEGGPVEVDHVSADNMGIGRVAFEYLQRQGCEHQAFVTDHPGWQIMRVRGQSFANSARDAGFAVTSFIAEANSLDREAYGLNVQVADDLAGLVDLILRADPRPTGLFIPTDLLTTKLYPLLIQRGVRPGFDIQVVSCDNENERLSMLNPRPASIDIRGEQIGRCAVRQLVQRLQRPDEPASRVQIAPQVIMPTLAPSNGSAGIA
jgi:DNA-binding LacI/PurR family transcriptional regulator